MLAARSDGFIVERMRRGCEFGVNGPVEAAWTERGEPGGAARRQAAGAAVWPAV